jgi:DegV family protein with EDD domain
MPGVKIVTDSAADISLAEAEEMGVEIVPLSIRFGDDEYTDLYQLTTEDFYETMESSDVLPETAAPSPGAFEQAFRKAADAGADTVVCINISSKISATMASAQNAARALDGEVDVRVCDSASATGGQGMIVAAAARAAAEGAGADEIVALVSDMAGRTRVFGTLDTLDNLQKGGRIGRAQAFAGSVLAIKPVIDISTGEVEEAAKPRTRKKAFAWLRDKLAEQDQIDELWLMHGQAPDIDDFVAMAVEVVPRDRIHIGSIGPVVGTHGGARVVGICWQDAG